jgi:trimeric autotransporter adhesin
MKAKLLSVAVALVALAAAPAPAIADSGGGSGGAGGFQAGLQSATTDQAAAGIAVSNQNAVNANVPVSIAGGNVSSGPSSANQTATSTATTDVSNKANTDQDQTLKQDIGGSDCHAGCGGAGGFQAGVQAADTNQWAAGISKSDQNAVNANVPVSVAGGDVKSGPSSANQTATSTATTDVSNKAKTDQDQTLKQTATTDVSNKAKTDQDQTLKQDIGGNDHCFAGCGGPGGFQAGVQLASTEQWALGVSKSDQNAVNANTPVSIAGGDVKSGPSSANQTATSTATTDVSNKAKTDQDQTLKQDIGSDGKDCHDRCDSKDGKDGKDGCHAGCGGAGGFQLGIQAASTEQWAFGIAKSDQNAVNSNAPHSVAGGNIYDGPSSANQTATSTASTDVSNRAKTDQNQWQWQRLG